MDRRLLPWLVAIGLLAPAAPAGARPLPTADAAAVKGHPRLIVTKADLPRLRQWARNGNPVYGQGLKLLARAMRERMKDGTVPSQDAGGFRYETYPTEAYAELFAFMSLIDPNAKARRDWGRRARKLLMHIVAKTKGGQGGDEEPWVAPLFSTSDRSRFQGEAYGLTLDWAYKYFSKADKQKIRKLFLRWAAEQYKGYPQTDLAPGTTPQPRGPAGDPRLLKDLRSVRFSVNNYYMAHARNLGLMAMALDRADDPGGKLGRHLRSITGQWLFVIDHMMRTDAAGGLSPEGFEYGAEAMGRLAQLLVALRTAGQTTGPHTTIADNPFWSEAGPALLHSLPTQPELAQGDNAFMGEVYRPAWFGDGEAYWATDPIALFGPLGLDAAARGDARTLNDARWMVKHIPPGGTAQLLNRVASTENFFGAILYFLLLDPDAPEPTDPRAQLPLTFFAPGIARLIDRTCWCAQERLFTFMLAWSAIDHQRGDGNDFSFERNGEWLTRVRVGYSNPFSDYHNVVTVQGDPFEGEPDDYRVIGAASGSQWGLAPAGDPALLARETTAGYAYALGDATKLYTSPSQGIGGVDHVSRSILWLKPDHIVVYDRVVTPAAGKFKRFWLQLPAVADVAGNRATVQTPRGQQLFVTAVEPAGAQLESTKDIDEGYPAVDESMVARLRIQAPGYLPSARFLTVLQGADGGAAPTPPTDLASTAGTPFAGAAVAGTAVLFPVDLGTPFAGTTVTLPADVTRVLVTGLQPSTGFTATRAGNTLTVSAGGPTQSSPGGVLDVS